MVRIVQKLRLFLFVVAILVGMPAHAATLPAGYTELEYLESTGEQYVELSFGFDPTDMILADFSVNIEEYSDKYMVAPKVWNSNHNKFAMGVHQGLYTIAYQDMTTGNTYLNPSKRNDGQIHKWIYGGYVFSIPELNISRDVSSIKFGTTTSNIRLFYGYNGGTKGKISYYKHIKANGTSVEMIPARRDSDGVLGMYDTVSGQFFTNAGTGDFIAGPAVPIKIATTKYNEQQFAPVETRLDAAVAAVDTVVTQTMTQAQQIDQIATNKQTRPDEGCNAKYCLLVEDEDGTPHWYPIAGANGVAHNLPAGYTELQYIESTGTQYIDTGVVKTTADNVYRLASKTSWADVQERQVQGCQDMFYYGPVAGYFQVAQASSSHTTTPVAANTVYEVDVTFDAVNNTATYSVNGTQYTVNIVGSNGSYMTSADGKNFAVFSLNEGILPFGNSKVYYYKLWKNGTLVRNMIPAKNSSGVIGMYDLADANPATAFHTNAGTGTFVAGPDM